MQCEFRLTQGRQCERIASHIHQMTGPQEGDYYAYNNGMERRPFTTYVCSEHSMAEDVAISNAQKDAVRVIEASSKPNRTYAEGAKRPTPVWYTVVRYTRAGGTDSNSMPLAKFRFEQDAIEYADAKRSLGTDYHYSIKAGR